MRPHRQGRLWLRGIDPERGAPSRLLTGLGDGNGNSSADPTVTGPTLHMDSRDESVACAPDTGYHMTSFVTI